MAQLLVVLAVFAVGVRNIEFSIELDYYSRSCFKEFITENTPFRFQVSSSISPKFQFSVSLRDGHILTKNPSDSSHTKRFDHFAPVSSNYIFCIENLADKQSFDIVYLSRIELSDINLLPKQEESKRVEKLVENVNSIYSDIREKEQYSMTVNEYNMELQKLVSFKSVGFGFLSITVVLVISFMHYLEIKRVLKNRKII